MTEKGTKSEKDEFACLGKKGLDLLSTDRSERRRLNRCMTSTGWLSGTRGPIFGGMAGLGWVFVRVGRVHQICST